MPLQIRRGTDAERAAMTQPLASGELLYVTDEQKIYVGNGTTLGGIVVSGYNDEDAQDAAASLFTTGTHSGISFTYNDTTGTINAVVDLLSFDGPVVADSLKGSVFADDSSLMVDAIDKVFYGNLTGTLTGYQIGDMSGSVFGDDSTLLIDAVNNKITAVDITASGNLSANRIVFGELALLDNPSASQIIIESVVPGTDGAAELLLNSYNSGSVFPTNRATLQLRSTHTDEDYENWDTWINGRIVFSRDDQNGQAAPAVITSRTSRLELKVHNRFGVDDFPESHGLYISTTTGYTGIGVYEAEAQLHNPGDSKLGDLLISQNNISTVDSNANIRLAPNGTGTIELSVPTQITVGAAGAAAAIPATPDIYFKVNINGTEYVVPGFAVS